MTDTLFQATLATARRLGIVSGWKASGTGSTTTLLDAVTNYGVDDLWNYGTIWITEDAGGASAAPEGEFSIITDYAQATGTFTFSVLTAATATSDKYVVSRPIVPLTVMIEAINQTLWTVDMPAWDTTSLDTVSGQTEYDLPAAVLRGDLVNVFVQTVDDANDNRPQEVIDWSIKEGITGAVDTLIIPQYAADWDLWLKYRTRHPEVRDTGDEINEIISLDALAIHAAVECLHWVMAEGDAESPFLSGRLNRLQELQDRYPITTYPVKGSRVRHNRLSQSRVNRYTGEVGKVRLVS